MLISREWLSEYINLDSISDEDLSKTLTQLGLEVETVETLSPLPLEIIVGEIKECKPHPDAQKLQICLVDIGQEKLQIVCGAANARAGLRVAVATVGTKLSEDFQIKASKIRGQDSFGMLCSEKELGLSDLDNGIMELGKSWQIGAPLERYAKKADTVFEISITPNRGDCLSYIGVARDLSAKLKRPVLKPKALEKLAPTKEGKAFSIDIEEGVACARFVAITIDGIHVTHSPFWLRQRLQKAGMRGINLIVDLANYVMLEQGQPLHTYDQNKISGNRIIVKSGTIGQKVKTLDGNDREVAPQDVVIADQKQILALGGVMGGANSEIDEKSQTLVLEAAYFYSTQIRKTAKRLSLHSEASQRFERGIDIENIPACANRYFQLLCQAHAELGLEAPKTVGALQDSYPKPQVRRKIALRISRLRKILSLPHLSLNQCKSHLEALGLLALDSTDDRLLVEVPPHRNDLNREVDLIEEVGRLEGYDKIPYELPRMEIRPNREDPFIDFLQKAKMFFANQGMFEAITYPFLALDTFAKLNISEDHPFWPRLSLKNPLSEEMAYLQTTLIPSLVQALHRNRSHGFKTSAMFEVSRGYHSVDCKNLAVTDVFTKNQFKHGRHCTQRAQSESKRHFERSLIAGVWDSTYHERVWNRPQEEITFFHAKDVLYRFLQSLGQTDIRVEKIDANAFPWLAQNKSAMLWCKDRPIGWFGELHPKAGLAFKFGSDNMVLFELDLEAVYDSVSTRSAINCQTGKFPGVERDFSFELAKTVSYSDVSSAIERFPARNFLRKFRLFDCYEGKQIAADKKSFSLSFEFASLERTLTDQEVDKEAQKLLQWLEKDLGLHLR